jgi:pyruvate, orthophosphate dikinase
MKEPRTFFIRQHMPLPETSAAEVGSKAWNLMRMAAAGLPVPPAFVLPVAWCRERRHTDADLAAALTPGIAALESATGLGFGSARQPLLVSVRSGSAVSMPGMMQTILNVGLNAESVLGLIRLTGNPHLAWDCYRRFIQSYSEVVHGLPRAVFDQLVNSEVAQAGGETVRDLDFRSLRKLAYAMLELFRERCGEDFPSDPSRQLLGAANAVFRSWDSPSAAAYRKLAGIPDDGGTAATVQRMVFGNASGASGSGVGFTRDPATGEHELYVDFAFHGQGEDVVGGRTVIDTSERLRHAMPEIWKQLVSGGNTLEEMFRDAQDFEFTVENGFFYILQSRCAHRTAWAALRIAVDLAEERLIEPREALSRVKELDPASLRRTRIAHPHRLPLAQAQVANTGIATGQIALDVETAKKMAESGSGVILVRPAILTEEIEGIAAATGVLTSTGGRTSHAAVVARQLGKVCLVACRDLAIDLTGRSCTIGGQTLQEGDLLSLDGSEGRVYAGAVETVTERPERELAAIEAWTRGAARKTA